MSKVSETELFKVFDRFQALIEEFGSPWCSIIIPIGVTQKQVYSFWSKGGEIVNNVRFPPLQMDVPIQESASFGDIRLVINYRDAKGEISLVRSYSIEDAMEIDLYGNLDASLPTIDIPPIDYI